MSEKNEDTGFIRGSERMEKGAFFGSTISKKDRRSWGLAPQIVPQNVIQGNSNPGGSGRGKKLIEITPNSDGIISRPYSID